MDVKGIAWVGHVYQKFEAMFFEVEENIYEDTVKYVENQVQTVGSSVKKFYSDVMEDLLPQSVMAMGAEKVETSGLPDDQDCNFVICKKPSRSMEIRVRRPDVDYEQSTEKTKVMANLRKGEAPASSSASLGGSVKKPFINSYSRLVDEGISEQFDVGFKGSLEKQTAEAEKLSVCSYRDQFDKAASPIGSITDEIKSGKVVVADCPLESSLLGSLAKSAGNEVEDTRLSSSVDSITDPDGVIDGLSPLNEMDEVFVSHPGVSDCCCVHEIESDEDGDRETEKLWEFDSGRLDESCVVVTEGDDVLFDTCRETKNRPYRMKILEAFSSKKHRTRKQEREHYAEWYGGDGNVETQNLGENDWELL